MTREEAIKHIITYAYYADDIPMQVATAKGCYRAWNRRAGERKEGAN